MHGKRSTQMKFEGNVALLQQKMANSSAGWRGAWL